MKINSKTLSAAVCIAIVLPFSAAAERGVCAHLWDKAEADGVQIKGEPLIKVIGNERLHVHWAPTDDCVRKDTFLVPGDEAHLHTLYKDWVTIKYINPKTKEYVIGWVKASRVLAAGN